MTTRRYTPKSCNIVCAVCGTVFFGRPYSKYCGKKCKGKAERAREYKRAEAAVQTKCRCGVVVDLQAVPDDLRAAWGSAWVCQWCLKDGRRARANRARAQMWNMARTRRSLSRSEWEATQSNQS